MYYKDTLWGIVSMSASGAADVLQRKIATSVEEQENFLEGN